MERAKEAAAGVKESLSNVTSKAGEAMGLKQPSAGERIERGSKEVGGGVKQGGEGMAAKIKETMGSTSEDPLVMGQVPTSSQPLE